MCVSWAQLVLTSDKKSDCMAIQFQGIILDGAIDTTKVSLYAHFLMDTIYPFKSTLYANFKSWELK